MLNSAQLPLELQDFITLFMGLIVEAFPFVVLGGLVSALVAIFLSPDLVTRMLPRNRLVAHGVIAMTGIFMPVCECGNIPVARRMVANGFTASQAITFLLAAPIINPITLWSTVEAFGWDSGVPQLRIFAAYFIAVGVGLIFSLVKNQTELLNENFYHIHCEHDHEGHDHDHAHDHDHLPAELKGKKLHQELLKLNPVAIAYFLRKLASIFQQEFMAVMPALAIGAMIAAATQTFVPREILVGLATNPVASVVVMMLLAFVISICANVDAFFALSYAGTFTVGSILTFLTFGPMIDIKILSMLMNTFRVKTIVTMAVLVGLSTAIFGLAINLLY